MSYGTLVYFQYCKYEPVMLLFGLLLNLKKYFQDMKLIFLSVASQYVRNVM